SGTNTMLAALDILLPKFSLESNELISFRRAMGVQGYGRSFNETFLARLVSVTPRVAPHAAKTVLNGFSKADRPAALETLAPSLGQLSPAEIYALVTLLPSDASARLTATLQGAHAADSAC
ncbi:MAG: hypothetical protein AAFY60_11035, partial [Myxococcota bacterium]